MPLLLIGLLAIYTLALGLAHPEILRANWYWAVVYYGTAVLWDTWTTLRGLALGYREGNPLYARALAFPMLGPLGILLVDAGLLSLKAFFLMRITQDPILSYALAFVIGGNGHLVGGLWNAGQILGHRLWGPYPK
ncbi:hypothetical protein [Thermus albus]|uniref:hypothetical protein n=1 Tax=Thermus albus TaxID=2908146 RepID=UPI001FA9D0F6|nr:hypothetical protein [Thermus albus]